MKLPQQPSEQDENSSFARPDTLTHDRKKTRLISVASLFVFVACTIVSFTGHAVDYPIMHFLNLFSRKHAVLDCSLLWLADNYLTSGIFLLSLIWYLWFCSTELHYRRRILIGTLGAAFSGIFSRGLQLTLPTHLRPLHDPALTFLPPLGVTPDTLNHWNSFPSDHAALYFGSWILSFEKRAAPAFYLAAFFVSYLIATLFDDLRELLAMPCLRAFLKRLLHL